MCFKSRIRRAVVRILQNERIVKKAAVGRLFENIKPAFLTLKKALYVGLVAKNQ